MITLYGGFRLTQIQWILEIVDWDTVKINCQKTKLYPEICHTNNIYVTNKDIAIFEKDQYQKGSHIKMI